MYTEYATTFGELAIVERREAKPDSGEYIEVTVREPEAPLEPPGNGWELVGVAASTRYLYWAWRRERPER